MKAYHNLILASALLLTSFTALSQKSQETKSLVDEGVALYDKGDYNGAIEKYNAALKINPNDLRADYEMAYTLETLSKGLDAVPFLEKILQSNDSKYETYQLLGTIYDENKQPEKAIEAYKAGIKEKPGFALLHMNLGITYMGIKKYPEAELEYIEALKLDPTHASNHRLYGLNAYGLKKRANSLLGWCNFLLLEPQSKRSAEGVAYVKNILNYGIKKNNEKNISINVSASDLTSVNMAIQMAVVASTVDKKGLSPVDSLTLQLTSVFKIIGEQSDKTDSPFFANFYAKYFKKLAESGNMPAFAHYVTLSVYKDEDLAWFKDHEKELNDLKAWTKDTQREF